MRRARPLSRLASLALIVLVAILVALSLAFVPKAGQPASLAFAAEPSANFEQIVDDEPAAVVEPVADGEKAAEGVLPAEGEQAAEPVASASSPQAGSLAAPQGDVSVALSQPDVSTIGDRVLYTTTLTASGLESFFGYQIQIAVPADADITIDNLVGGSATEPVMRDGSLYFATILGEKQSGEIAVCEIQCSYPSGSSESDRSLTVTTLKIVTSIASESVLTLGPDPVAASLALSSTNLLFGLPLWVVAGIIIAVIIGIFVVVRLVRRSHHSRARHSHRSRASHFKTDVSSQCPPQAVSPTVARRRAQKVS